MARASPLLAGILYALGAGLTWGLVFVGPLLLPDYPAALQSFGRYLAFGLIALPLAGFDRRALRELNGADWLEALKLALVGNVVYYLLLASAIQRTGGPLPTMVIGTLPVVLALVSRWRDAHSRPSVPTGSARIGSSATQPPGPNRPVPTDPVEAGATVPVAWRRLAPSLVLIGLGIALVNQDELRQLRAGEIGVDAGIHTARYLTGALLAAGAVACWTWYPLRNAAWLRAHPARSPRAWATAQGLATLPLALAGYAAVWAAEAAASRSGRATAAAFAMPFGPRPAFFVFMMFAIGLLASWLGTLCWNEASRRLPPTLAGQLIVFETLAALGYCYAFRGGWPPVQTLAGAALLVAGVVLAARAERRG